MVGELALAAATVNRRLFSLKSLVKLARLTGRITWTIDVPGLRRSPLKGSCRWARQPPCPALAVLPRRTP